MIRRMLTALALLATTIPAQAADCGKTNIRQVDQLLACVKRDDLWRHLSVFQSIANANPGPLGHGNRDTGTPGYKASVAYVAKLMHDAGYHVTIQSYDWEKHTLKAKPIFSSGATLFQPGQDYFVARLSPSGHVDARLQPATGAGTGCTAADFAAFTPGHIALLARGGCDPDDQVAAAQAAGAAAVVLYNSPGKPGQPGKLSKDDGTAYQALLTNDPTIPVIGMASNAAGAALAHQYAAGASPRAIIDVQAEKKSATDYNLIADSPYGDPNSIIVLEGHLDAIYGAGMLDNASGSTTILDIALNLANTQTRNQMRYIWFGGEELGLLGSHYYTRHLSHNELKRLAFDIDADVTATPNFVVDTADPKFAPNARKFPPHVVPDSRIGNQLFNQYFHQVGIPVRSYHAGNDGTDSNSFALVGVPNTGILTQQDCCKSEWQVKLWGGFRGNYEGKIPSFNGGCVDQPHRWCDNLSNNDPFVLEFASKAVAYVTYTLANRDFSGHR